MPTYEYKCENCNDEFEEFQSIKAEPKAKCPKCGHNAKRMISLNTGIIFKGKGFYVNDYKNKKNKETSCQNKKESSTCENCSAAKS